MRVSGLVLAAFALFVGLHSAHAQQPSGSITRQATPLRADLGPTRPALNEPDFHVAQLRGLVQSRLENSDAQALAQAAQGGDVDAQLALAAAHIYGLGGIAASAETGAYWASQACNADRLTACVSLAHLHIAQPDRFPASVAADAAERLDDHCDDDAYAACYLRARLLESGLHVERNERRALRLYRDACENGIVESCNRAGSADYIGQRGSPDLDRAIRYFALACELGDDLACLDATIAAVDEYAEASESYGVPHPQEEFQRRVARRDYAPRFVENLMTPWVYWPGADLSEHGLTPVLTATLKIVGRYGVWQRTPPVQSPIRAMLYTVAHEQGSVSNRWTPQHEQAADVHCPDLDIAACFGEVMTLLAGSETARSAEPDWALMTAYCGQDVLIACRLGELSDDWAYLIEASDEALVLLLSPYCLREEEPHVQACRYAGDAALRLAQNDPFYFTQALPLHRQGCDATGPTSFCTTADENPLSGVALMDAYRRNDLDHIRLVLEAGGAIQGEQPTARYNGDVGRFDLAAQAVIDERIEVLRLINEYVDLTSYRMIGGQPLILAAQPFERVYRDGAIQDVPRFGYDGRRSTYLMTWEAAERMREHLLDMGLSPIYDTAAGMSIYDLFDSIARGYARAEQDAGYVRRRAAADAERDLRRRQAEARQRQEMRDAILMGMTQALSDANERLAAENRARDEANRREMREINNRAQNIAAYHQRRTEAARDNRNSDASFGTDAASQARIAELTRERQRIAEAAEERRRNEEARAARERRQQERNAAIRREREERRESEYRAGQRAEVERARLAARDAELVRQQWASNEASNSTVSALDWQQNALMACERTGENLRLQSPNHEFAAAENAFSQGCQIAHWLKYSTAGSNVLHCHKRDEFQDDLYDRLSERGLTAYSNYGDQAWLAWQQNMGCTDAD
jgi:hypothetical protein